MSTGRRKTDESGIGREDRGPAALPAAAALSLAGQIGNHAFAQVARSINSRTPADARAFDASGASARTVARDITGTEGQEAEPMGIVAQTRPLTRHFSIANEPLASWESERFTVNDGRVTISADADWNPMSQGAPDSYTIMLYKWGILSDDLVPSVFGAWTRSRAGRPQTNTWRDLASGSYFVRIGPELNLVDANATFDGSITVT